MNTQLQRESVSDFRRRITGQIVAGAAPFEVVNAASEWMLTLCLRADLEPHDGGSSAAKAAFRAWVDSP
jgi:hypothetical protein